MANRRLAISSLLSSDSSTPGRGTPIASSPQSAPLQAARTNQEQAATSNSQHNRQSLSPTVRHASPPLQFSLPPALTRRTPSPTTLDDAPPMKRHKSDPEADIRKARQNTYQRQYSPVSPTHSTYAGKHRASYKNPSFYKASKNSASVSPRSPTDTPRRPLHSMSTGDVPRQALHKDDQDELQPVPLATYTQTTNTEQRWEESRSQSSGSGSGSGSHSPVVAKTESRRVRPGSPHMPPLAALATLATASKAIPIPLTSVREERSHANPPPHHASSGLASLKIEEPSRIWTQRPAGPSLAGGRHTEYQAPRSAAGPIDFPSSAERDKPASPIRSPSSSFSAHSVSHPPVSPDSPRAMRMAHGRTESGDAHDWLLEHFAGSPPGRASQRGVDEAGTAANRNPEGQAPSQVPASEPNRDSSTSVPDSPTVDDELLLLIDGPEDGSPEKQHARDKDNNAKVEATTSATAKRGIAANHSGPAAAIAESGRVLLPTSRQLALGVPVKSFATGAAIDPCPSSASPHAAAAKPKAPKRSRAPGNKKKADGAVPRSRKKVPGTATSATRSRSTSVHHPLQTSTSRTSSPGPPLRIADNDDMVVDREVPKVTTNGDSEKAARRDRARAMDDEYKLYCVCKTPYDEERVMIACDRCDEWYHTACVKLPELELDLIDQFVCPVCTAANPSLNTSYKMRCHRGLTSSRAASPSACFKPARLPLSKYCSDDCGMTHVAKRLQDWESQGGSKEAVWNTVKTARKVEGVVIEVKPPCDKPPHANGTNGEAAKPNGHVNGVNKELARLRALLDQIMRDRTDLLRALDMVRARERLVEVNAVRSDKTSECGWDERLLFGDSEWRAWIARTGHEGGSWLLAGDSDPADVAEDPAWWCTGKKKCDRHSGWQKLRLAEVEVDKAVKNQILELLTTRERDVRRCIEDLEPPDIPFDSMPSNSKPRINSRGSRGGGPRFR